MNKEKKGNLFYIIAFVLTVCLFICSVVCVFLLSKKVDHIAVGAAELTEADQFENYVNGKEFVLKNNINLSAIKYEGIGNIEITGQFYCGENVYTSLILTYYITNNVYVVRLRKYVNDEPITWTLCRYEDDVLVEMSYQPFIIAYCNIDENDFIKARSWFNKTFDLKPFKKLITKGVYSMKSDIFAPITLYPVYSVLPNVQIYYEDEVYTGFTNMFVQNMSIYINNWHVFGSDGVRQAESEVFTLIEDVPCNDDFYWFFTSYYTLAPTIKKGEYFINEEFLFPSQIVDDINYKPFARLYYKSNNQSFKSMYFGTVVGGGIYYDAMYYSTLNNENLDGVTVVYDELRKWLNANYRNIEVLEDAKVSWNFFEWFMSEFESYYKLNGTYVWNKLLTDGKVDNTNYVPIDFNGNSYLGYFTVYDSDLSFQTTSMRSIYFDKSQGKLVFSGLVDGVSRDITVYEGYNWLSTSFRFIQFYDYRVTIDVYNFIVLNTVESTDWVVNGNFYETGYENGYKLGEESGYNKGYLTGESYGYNSGYSEGYYAGLETAENTSLSGLLITVVSAPFNMVYDFLDFSILGYNLNGLFFSLLSLCVVIAVIRWILR